MIPYHRTVSSLSPLPSSGPVSSSSSANCYYCSCRVTEERHGDYLRLKVEGPLDLARAFESSELQTERDEEEGKGGEGGPLILDYNISQFSLEQAFLSALAIETTTPL